MQENVSKSLVVEFVIFDCGDEISRIWEVGGISNDNGSSRVVAK